MIPSFRVVKTGVRAHNQIVKWKARLMVGRFFPAGSGVQGSERIIKWIVAKTTHGAHAHCSCKALAGLRKHFDAGLNTKCAQWPPAPQARVAELSDCPDPLQAASRGRHRQAAAATGRRGWQARRAVAATPLPQPWLRAPVDNAGDPQVAGD